MLQAMNTGHDGSITTVHANTPRDALARIEQMIGMAGIDLPPKSMRGQIASAINAVIQIKRFPDGTRRVVSIQEMNGMEGDVITMQEIFRFEQTGVDPNGKVLGRFVLTGVRPRFLEDLQGDGHRIPRQVFRARQAAGLSAMSGFSMVYVIYAGGGAHRHHDRRGVLHALCRPQATAARRSTGA